MIWDSGTTDLSAYKGENDELVFPSVSPATSTKVVSTLFFVYGDLLEWLCLRFFFGNKLCTAAFFKMMKNAYFYGILM